MGRIRTIKPEFPQSESMGRVSREARLCFILLWTVVDDTGKARASSRLLASLLYPYDGDAGSFIDGWLCELEREQCLMRYEVDGNSYIKILKWLNHQKIDHASTSRLPDPSEDSLNLARNTRTLAPDLGPVPRTVVPVPSTNNQSAASAAPMALTSPETKPAKNKSEKEFILPDWIPSDLWDHWVNNRKAINKPIKTDHAKNLAVKDLEKFRDEGYDISAILNEAVLKNWLGLFANSATPKIPKPKVERRTMTQREIDEDNYRHLGVPPPEEWAPVDAPQGWVPCRN